MPLLPPCKIEKVSQKIRPKFDIGLSKNENWLTWMYCGILKNPRDNSQPEVLVCFRKTDTYNVSDNIIPRRVPLSALSFFRIGSILRNNICESVALFEEVKLRKIQAECVELQLLFQLFTKKHARPRSLFCLAPYVPI